MQDQAPTFATFWAGTRLSAYEASCLHSFAVRGYQTFLYSFDQIGNVPAGVTLLDAAAIADPGTVTRFLYEGKPNLSHYSDYFRYQMFRKTEHCWVDADLLLLKAWELPAARTLLAYERADSINGAVMRLDNTRPELEELVTAAEAIMDRNLQWGETGPRLVTKVFREPALLARAYPPHIFFPINHDDFWKMFLPEYAEECELACQSSTAVHLWNNIVDKLGVWKELAPPAGSFLTRHFEANGSLKFFRDQYPERVMRQMAQNWRFRQDGGDLGIAGLSRQILPSILRTARHHFGERLPGLKPSGRKTGSA